MNKALIKKSITETLILFAAIAACVFAFAWFRVWVVSELDTTRFKQILDLLPDDWQKFTTVEFEWLITYLGRTALTLDEPFLIMLVAIFAIVRGTDVVSGEISRGTMEMLLSQPVSRRQIFWTPVLTTLIGVLLLCLLIWFGMWLGVQTTSVVESVYPTIRVPIIDYHIPLTFLKPKEQTVPMSDHVDPMLFIPGVFNLGMLCYFLLGLATLVSAFDRFRWRTLGIVIGFYFLSAMAKILAMASKTFGWLNYCSFFSCYEPELAIQLAEANWSSQWQLVNFSETGMPLEMGPMGNNLVFAVLGSACLLIAAHRFRTRDIPAPT
ncbi:MAG TPA: ABC transporter permease subunit [Pirellulaceae bacterium]|nr:ABC transporter permease subunit [Pirellulaceae bacterium]HMO92078.1 ABC transporter permease subunit [Pirellulaceae bacterium]HMP69334.1 ABC transporter permease subunit [Pirellulaceae bacterium]